MATSSDRTLVVLGGGIAGLAAALELTGSGVRNAGVGRRPRIVLLEADARLGGVLVTEEFGGRPVDLGADSLLARRPEAIDLADRLGVHLDPVAASGAAVWARGRRRPLPRGLHLGVPTSLRPVLTSGILTAPESVGLVLDRLFPRRDHRNTLGDRPLGPLIEKRLGSGVATKLVDPMLGGIHAGSIDDMSTAALLPFLLALSHRRTGLAAGLGRALQLSNEGPPDGGDVPSPVFLAPTGGMEVLVTALEGELKKRGVEIECEAPAVSLELTHRGSTKGWRVHTGGGPSVTCDGVVVALPATPSAGLLFDHDPEIARLLSEIAYAPVATITMEFALDAVPADLYGTGLLAPRIPSRSPPLVTAFSYLSTKWPGVARPTRFLLRASVGRTGDRRFLDLDDAELVARVLDEASTMLEIAAEPLESRVKRWPSALPQYRTHHLLRVATLERAVGELPPLALAGAALRGVGIPACIASGRAAAHRVAHAIGVGATESPS